MGPSPSPTWIPFPTAVYRAAAPRRSRPPPIRAVPGALPLSAPLLRPRRRRSAPPCRGDAAAPCLSILSRHWHPRWVEEASSLPGGHERWPSRETSPTPSSPVRGLHRPSRRTRAPYLQLLAFDSRPPLASPSGSGMPSAFPSLG
ncbi:hypothetical protein PVAP13_9KG618750 [Panicum virgatum]|uniref:Uncharacterized protein n=1 Tax=Panicum virgatum TaxID=38727 RepID=A0A8T0NVW2_PANVG|nr:hypothetical protein PVAP13_9KG618750 [Panicum virgatum]